MQWHYAYIYIIVEKWQKYVDPAAHWPGHFKFFRVTARYEAVSPVTLTRILKVLGISF